MKCQSTVILKMSDIQSLPQSILMKEHGCAMAGSLFLLSVWCPVGFVLFGPKHDRASLHLNLVLVDGVQRAQCTTTCSAHGWHQRRVLSISKGGWKGHHEIRQKADLRSRFFSTQRSLSKLWGLSGWALASWSVKGRWQKYQPHKVVFVRNKRLGSKGTKHAIRHPGNQEKALPLAQAGASRKVGATWKPLRKHFQASFP